MSRQFNARYRLTLDDYAAMSAAYARLRPARRIGRVLRFAVEVLLFAAAAGLALRGEWLFSAYFAALGLIALAIQFFVEPWQRGRQFRDQRIGDVEVALRADENGIVTKSEVADGAVKWGAIRHVDDLPEQVVLLAANTRLGFIVPKRGFATPAEAAAFAGFAREKIGDEKL